MHDAFAPRPAKDAVVFVLTIGRAESPDAPTDEELERWEDSRETWSELGSMTSALLKRLNRMQCREHGCATKVWDVDRWGDKVGRWTCMGRCEPHGGRWCSVIEQHRVKAGQAHAWPHVNLVVFWPWLARKVRAWKSRGKVTRNVRVALVDGKSVYEDKRVEDGRIPTGEILEHVVGARWGYQSWAETIRSKDGLAGYFGKIAGEASGELSKTTQLPLHAPQGFRRLRSGRGFLAPRFKRKALCGTIISKVGSRGWRSMARGGDVRVFVADVPPRYRPSEPTRWLDMREGVVYTEHWPGWSQLDSPPVIGGDPRHRPQVLVLDLREGTHRVRQKNGEHTDGDLGAEPLADVVEDETRPTNVVPLFGGR